MPSPSVNERDVCPSGAVLTRQPEASAPTWVRPMPPRTYSLTGTPLAARYSFASRML